VLCSALGHANDDSDLLAKVLNPIGCRRSRRQTTRTRSFTLLRRQRCIAGSAPGTPCTTNSSSLGARRRLEHYDAAGALACARRRNDVTGCNGVNILRAVHCGQIGRYP